MAYIVDFVQNPITAISSTFIPVLPGHIADDLLLAFAYQDGGGTEITVSAGWTRIGTQAAAGGARSIWAYKIAASSSETAPTFTGASDEWAGCTVVVRDAHASPFGSTPTSGTDFLRTDWTAGYSAQAGSITTAVADCLLLYSWGFDAAASDMIIKPEEAIILDRHKVNVANYTVAYTQQGAAGATPTPTLYLSQTDSGNSWVLAIRNKSGGALQPMIRPSRTEINLYGAMGALHSAAVSWDTPATLLASGTTIGGVSLSSVAPTINNTLYSGWSWAQSTTLSSAEVTAALWVGGSHAIAETDFRGKIFSVHHVLGGNTIYFNADAAIIVFASSTTDWAAFKVWGKETILDTAFPVIYIDTDSQTPDWSGGTIDWSAITGIGYFTNRTGNATSATTISIRMAELWDRVVLTGGGANRPATLPDLVKQFNAIWEVPPYMALSGQGQCLCYLPITIGNGGANATYFDSGGVSLEYPKVASFVKKDKQIDWFVPAGGVDVKVNAGASDTISFARSIARTQLEFDLTIDSSSSTSATYDFSGCSIIGWDVAWKSGISCSRAIFDACPEMDGKDAAITNCVFSRGTEAYVLGLDAGASVAGSSFTKGSDTYAIKLRTAGTYTLNGATFTGYTTPIKITATTGTVTLTLAAGQAEPAYSSDGATVVYSQPQQKYGISISGLIAGSQVVVYEAGTTTEKNRNDNTGTTYSWSELGTSLAVDYTVQRAGYLPQRFAGITLTAIQSSSGNQIVDRAYAASSGITFGSTGTVTVGTKVFGLTAVSTGKNWYSFLIESWIAQSSLRNVDFPVSHDGDESFTLGDGWEFSSTNWSNLRRCGIRYLSTSDVLTATYAGLLSIGDIGSNTAQIQQSDGANQVAASATGDIDQLIQVYGDASHNNIDFTGHLVAKAQVNGYLSSAYDIIVDGGISALSDKLYSFPLNLVSSGIATGDPGITGVTITDHAGSPVTWNSKVFSITITDSGTNSGADIAKWISYNLAQGGTFQGKATFNWHDMVLPNGDGYKTIRGPIYGDTGATLKGVRVLRGTDAHPDFNVFTADDGTTYSPPEVASVTLSGVVAGSTVQIWDTTSNTQLGSILTAAPYYWSETYSANRAIRIRAMYQSGTFAKMFLEANIGSITEANPQLTYLVNQVDDNVYAANAIDGSTITGITINDALLLINVSTASISLADIYAYETYWLSTAAGIIDKTRIITAVDTANYIFSDFKIKNVGTGPLVITGGYMQDANTGAALDIIDTSGGTIFLAPDHVVPYAAGAEATVAIVQSGLTAQGYTTGRAPNLDNLDAAVSSVGGGAAPTAEQNASAVRTELSTELAMIEFANKVIKNKKEITLGKDLVIYDDDNTTPILQKDLSDWTGNAISDLANGILAREGKSSV